VRWVKKKMADKAEALRKEEEELKLLVSDARELGKKITAISDKISEQAGDEKFRQELKEQQQELKFQQQKLEVQIAESKVKIAEWKEKDAEEIKRLKDVLAALQNPQVSQGSSHKRITVGNTAGVYKFLRYEVRTQLPARQYLNFDSRVSLDDRCLVLNMHLNDQKGRPETLIVRSCYSLIYTKYVKPNVASRQKDTFIIGPKGTGKSVLSDLLALALFEEGEVVLLEHFNHKLLFIRESSRPAAIADVKKCLELSEEYDATSIPSKEESVFELTRYGGLFSELCHLENVVVIQDVGDSPGINLIVDGPAPKIWVSSPNAGKLKFLEKIPTKTTLVVPAWSEEEMLKLQVLFNPHSKEPDEIQDLLRKYGGVPRVILESKTAEATSMYEEYIANAEKDEVRNCFTGPLERMPKGNISGYLVHVRPKNPEDLEHYTRSFATQYISERMFQKMVADHQWSAQLFNDLVREIPEFRGFSGRVLERNMHLLLPKGHTVKIRPLGPQAAFSQFKDVTIGELKVHWFEQDNFSDVDKKALEAKNTYFQPRSKIFPTLDAFAILPLDLFVANGKGVCLVSLQSTVGTGHSTNGQVLNRLEDYVKPIYKNIRCFHVFVTGANGIRTEQKVLKEDKKEYAQGYGPKFTQYALSMGDEFDRLVDEANKKSSS